MNLIEQLQQKISERLPKAEFRLDDSQPSWAKHLPPALLVDFEDRSVVISRGVTDIFAISLIPFDPVNPPVCAVHGVDLALEKIVELLTTETKS